MELELDLVPAGGGAPDPESVRGAFPGNEPPAAEGNHLVYRSPLTGVTFSLLTTAEGVRASLPLVRPSFFGAEIASLLAPLARRLRLGLAREGAAPEEADEGRLAEAWRDANRRATEREWRSQLGSLPWLPEARLNAWSAWQRELPARQRREVLFAPQIDLLLDLRDGTVKTAAAWPDLRPQVIPEVDLLLVSWVQKFEKRRRSGILGRKKRLGLTEKEVGGYLPFEQVRAFLGKHATRTESPLPHHRFEGGAAPAASIDLDEILRPEAFQPLGIGEVVDVRP